MCALLVGATASPRERTPESLRGEIFASFRTGDFEQAAQLIDRYLELRPDDGAMIYNAACARCRMGDLPGAEALLMKSLKAGFLNFARMRRDPDIAALRGRPVFRAILAARDAADGLLAQRRMDDWKRRFGADRYRSDTDAELHLSFVTALDEEGHARLRRRVTRQAEHLAATLFEQPPGHNVLVAVPHPEDAATLFHDPHVHGCYRHGLRQLVTTDTDVALRHELVHAFHHHHMDRCGQEHPIWIQEGLGCLYESCRLDDDGALLPVVDDRHALVSRMAERGELPSWTTLMSMPRNQFMAEPATHYALARSVLAFIASEGALASWYRGYVDGFADDTTGIRALERALGAPVEQLEGLWRAWLSAAERAADEGGRPDAFDVPDPDAGRRALTHEAFARARAHYAAGRFHQTITALDEVFDLDEAHADAHYTLGLIYVRLDDHEAAVRQHAILSTLDPSLTSLLGNLTTPE
ncbi:MAG: hypothetical protein GY715_07575 [Planctomycetes bacterium]|nr:hypothetical protein [Planctomycetota bacterium]